MANLTKKANWNLSVFITSLSTEKPVEVTGQTHIGKLMLDLVEGLDISADWSDHGLWWPQRRQWLLKPRITLDTCGVQGDAKLHFTPIHKKVRVQLPDLQFVELSMDFSKKVFVAVQELCAELGIRHPEELSLMKPNNKLKKDARRSMKGKKKRHSGSGISPGSASPGSPAYSNFGPEGPFSTLENTNLNQSPLTPSQEALNTLCKPKSIQEKAYLNSGWLDSSRSLMEQEVQEFDTIYLRYKYYTFFDLNPKVDEIRINQLYEQAKWSILTEEVECTEEEMMSFAAIQFQVKILSASPQSNIPEDDDDIDAALSDLQLTLEGSSHSTTSPAKVNSLNTVPEIMDYLNLVNNCDVKHFLSADSDTTLTVYKSQEEAFGQPVQRMNLRGCEVTTDVNVSKDKYQIRMRLQDNEEIELACSTESQYAKWMAACRMASKGKTMADISYESEKAGIQAFLSMQHDKGDGTPLSPGQIHIQPEDFVGQRMLKKYKPKQIAARILESHTALHKASLVESKMMYIRQWQSLPEFGVSHFIVRFRSDKPKKEEILGIAFNRIMRIDASTREAIKTWRYSVMRAWNVNWETREMIVQCEDEMIAFNCVSADIKAVHEFIGGYIFLSMRKDVNQPPSDELFYKLTGGWV
ncbi:predicted protein [Nematostella vectensis]|uniref:FERM domain-containing protein n=1 Tax=Nematostella vectensis TaxID=45351 RepID=A7SIB3_NEMVE|nr:predicted protein [Nematostella vectensis]|eukprot:XP_001628628.1 predicted protein [Nematostella vectensis]